VSDTKVSRENDMPQPAVEALVQLGALPSSVNAEVSKLEQFERLLGEVQQPISDDDARLLVKLFGPDDCFGIAWTLVHLIETAPGWPLEDSLGQSGNEWIDYLRQRSEN
jgi:hypothetical protein